MSEGCRIRFTQAENDWAYRLLEGLLQAGETCETLDQGYSVVNYTGKACPNPRDRSCVIGAHDGRVQADDVFEYALNRGGDYQSLIEGTLGRPVPWALDDLDPSTAFDARIRERVTTAITLLDISLQSQGIDKGSVAYEEILAMGLFSFAIIGEVPNQKEIQASPLLPRLLLKLGFNVMDRILGLVGLQVFSDYLQKEGGLGVAAGDFLKEYTALEALAIRKGKCTEDAKILYAILKMAGFSPVFVLVDQVSEEPSLATYAAQLPPGGGHVCIGIEIGGRFRLLDPALKSFDAPYSQVYPLSLRQFWSRELINRGIPQAGHADAAIAYNRQALKLDRENPEAHVNWGVALMEAAENHPQALVHFSEAIRINPKATMAYNNRGFLWMTAGDLDKAIADFSEAVTLDPRSAMLRSNRGAIWALLKEWDKAEADLKEALRINPKLAEAYHGLGLVHMGRHEWGKAIRNFKEVLERNPSRFPHAYVLLGICLFKEDRPNQALKAFAAFLQSGAEESVLTGLLFALLQEEWQTDPEQKQAALLFEAETGAFDLARVQTSLLLAYSLWVAGDRGQAREKMTELSTLLNFERAPSQSTKDFFHDMFRAMPATMQRDAAVQSSRNTLLVALR